MIVCVGRWVEGPRWDGMAVEKGEEERAVLLYTEAACPGFLESRLAGAGQKVFSIFRWGFPTVLNLYIQSFLELHTHLTFKSHP